MNKISTFIKSNAKWLVPTVIILIIFFVMKEKNRPVAKRIDDIKEEAKT